MVETECQIAVRRMRFADLEQAYAIEQQVFQSPWSLQTFEDQLLETPHARLWVAENSAPGKEDEIVGILVAWVIIDELHIGSIAVAPAHQRQGIATKLLNIVLSDMRAAGIKTSMLEVRQSNLPAQKLYKNFGFEVVGHRRGYYSDTGEDALLMTAVL